MPENQDSQPKGEPAGLRDVPADITEYKKFVETGGNEHNSKILNSETAVADARAAGILPSESETEEIEAQERKKENRFNKRIRQLRRDIGERDRIIETLKQNHAGAPNGAAP